VVSEQDLSVYFRRRGKEGRVLKLCRLLQVHNSQKTVRLTVRKGWKHSWLQSDSNKFSRRADRNRKMATEGHGRGGKKNHQ
jgi:hypothetical protein